MAGVTACYGVKMRHALKITFAASKAVSERLHARQRLFCGPVYARDIVRRMAQLQ